MKTILCVLVLLCFVGVVSADIYTVTNHNDTGAGSMRYGIENAPSSRTMVFTGLASGNITQASVLTISKCNIIIDGLTASGAITITGHGVKIMGNNSDPDDATKGSNITIRGFRFRNITAYDDEIWVMGNSRDVLIEYCSFDAPSDGMVDVTQGGRDVEIRYNVFINGLDGVGSGSNLISYGAYNVSFHHNLAYRGKGRQPQYNLRECESYTTCNCTDEEIMADVRYNIVWDHRTGTTSEDAKSNFKYNLHKNEDGWPTFYSFMNNDNNAAGGDNYTTQVNMSGNICINDCRNVPNNVTNSNWHNNHDEFSFHLTVPGANLSNTSAIIDEWWDALNNSGLISEFTDDAIEAAARAAVTMPNTTIFDEPWNAQQDYDSWSVDTSKAYYNTTSVIYNIVNASGYFVWDRQPTESDTECNFNLEVTIT